MVAECRLVGYNLLIFKRTFQVKKVKSDNENASLWCVLGETKAAQAAQCSFQHWGNRLLGNHHISVKMRGPLYKFNSSSLKDRLVSLDMKVKTEFVSICIYFQIVGE